jgi:transposase-like protein
VEAKLIELGYDPTHAIKREQTAESETETETVQTTARKKRTTVTEELKEQVVNAYFGGMSRSEICDKFDISRPTLYRILAEPEPSGNAKKEPVSAQTETSPVFDENEQKSQSQFYYTPETLICQALKIGAFAAEIGATAGYTDGVFTIDTKGGDVK